jgi:hypothetical protein
MTALDFLDEHFWALWALGLICALSLFVSRCVQPI